MEIVPDCTFGGAPSHCLISGDVLADYWQVTHNQQISYQCTDNRLGGFSPSELGDQLLLSEKSGCCTGWTISRTLRLVNAEFSMMTTSLLGTDS